MLLQKELGRAIEFALLGAGDGFQRAAQSGFLAVAHFYEHQHLAILHDQIDLAGLAAEVAGDQAKSLSFQMALRQCFRLVALVLLLRWVCDVHRLP